MIMHAVQQILLILLVIVCFILLAIGLRLLILNLSLVIVFFFRSGIIRKSTWWLSHNLGRMRNWMRSKWLPPVFWLLVLTIFVWLVGNLNKFNLNIGSWFQGWSVQALYTLLVGIVTGILSQWVTILVLFTLGLLLWSALKAGKRVVVEEFVDYTGNQASSQTKPVAGGLATLLVVRLAQLRVLYQSVDEQRAIPTSVWINQSIDATINVEDVSQFLKDAVSAQSEFNLGPFKIPVGTLLSLIGRIVQGPRIVGSLHKDGDTFILTAQKFDSKGSQSWRVDRKELSDQDSQQRKDRLTDMVEELAYRVFTDLALNGSVRWRATSNFCEGLQAYRDCLRSPKDRRLNLEVAQQKFIETLAEDQKFEMAYYNLGVVYTELEQLEAARIAFSSAVKEYPGRWNAYYALALNRFQSTDAQLEPKYEAVIELCKRVIDLKPGSANTAKAYQLRGLAQDHLGLSHMAIRSFRKAVAYSWRALCQAELNGQGVSEAGNDVLVPLETLASGCLANLASQHMRSRAFIRAKALLRQAMHLKHCDVDYYANCYFLLGELHFARNKFEPAAKEYRHAVRIYPERKEYVASQALAYARASRMDNVNAAVRGGREAAALDACQQALDCASQVSTDVIQKVAEAYEVLGDKDRGTRVRGMQKFLHDIDENLTVAELEKMSHDYDSEDKEWECGQVYRALGHYYYGSGDFVKSKENFEKAIKKLQIKHPEEVRVQRLYMHQAYSLLEQEGKKREAVELMEHAVKLDSVGYREREALGYVYYKLNQFDQAIDAWQEALSRRNALLKKPDDDEADIVLNIGISYASLAIHCREYQKRSQALEDATRHLKQALHLYEGHQQVQKARACYWLGRLHIELGRYWEAASFLKISQTLGYIPLTSAFYLGYAYLRNREYDESIEQFKGLLDSAKKLDDNHFPVDTIVEGDSEGEMSLGEILAIAYWGQAFAFAQRNANLENALKFIQVDAHAQLKRLDMNKTKIRWPAIYPDCEGWILYKLGRAEEAVERLEQAIMKETDAEYYLHLALAYVQKLLACGDKNLVDKVQVVCQQILELDIEKKFEREVSDLAQRLKEISQEISSQRPTQSLLKRIF